MVLRNFLDEKVFLLHVTIILICFQSEKSQNKLDSMQSILLKRFTKLVKMNVKREQSKNSHASVILNSQFAWIFTKALFYILSRLSASKLKKSIKIATKTCNHERIIRSNLKAEVDALLNITCRKVMIPYCLTKSNHFKIFDWLVLRLQDTETETLKPHYIHVYKVFG